MAAIEPEEVAQYGLSMNKINGIYNHDGVELDVKRRLRVEAS
jgi:hypothetical protein